MSNESDQKLTPFKACVRIRPLLEKEKNQIALTKNMPKSILSIDDNIVLYS